MVSRFVILLAVLACCAAAPSRLVASQNVIVVVDDSGSMMDRMRSGVRRIEAAKDSLKLVLGRLPEDASVGVLALNQGWIVPLQPVRQSQVGDQIDHLDAVGGTLLGQNLKLAADELLQLRAKQVYGDYRLLIVTDGEANDQPVLEFVLQDVLSRGLTVDVIGVDMQSDHSLATKVHNYRRADDPATLEQAIAESLAESDARDEDLAGEESDFELIAGLPPEMATTIIGALTTARNSPVGESKVPPPHVENDLGFDLQGSPPVPNPGPGGRDGGRGFSMGPLVCMGVLFFGISTISAMLKAGRRRRR